jgi:hypothetical protein
MIGSETLNTFLEELRDYLRTLFPEMRVCCGFRKEPDYREWEVPVLSLAVNGVKTEPVGFQNYLGAVQNDLTYGECFGSQAEVTLAFTLFFPLEETKQFETSFFLELAEGLLFWQEADFYEMNCKPVVFSEHSQCFILEAEGKTRQVLAQTEESVLLTGVKVIAAPQQEETE